MTTHRMSKVLIVAINHVLQFLTTRNLAFFIPDWCKNGEWPLGLAMMNVKLAAVDTQGIIRAAPLRHVCLKIHGPDPY